jgi:hypothetical protein
MDEGQDFRIRLSVSASETPDLFGQLMKVPSGRARANRLKQLAQTYSLMLNGAQLPDEDRSVGAVGMPTNVGASKVRSQGLPVEQTSQPRPQETLTAQDGFDSADLLSKSTYGKYL